MDDHESHAFLQYSDRINHYITDQGTESDRKVNFGDPPWPTDSNVMLEYIFNRAREIWADETEDGFVKAIIWVATHAWFEGALDERSESRRR